MDSGRNNLQHRGAGGGGGPGRGSGGGGHRYYQNQSVRGSRRWCDAPQRYSPRQLPNRDSRPPVQGNQPPPPRASGYRRASTAPSVQPPLQPRTHPQPGHHWNQVSRACSQTWRAFRFTLSFEWWPRLFFSFSYSQRD